MPKIRSVLPKKLTTELDMQAPWQSTTRSGNPLLKHIYTGAHTTIDFLVENNLLDIDKYNELRRSYEKCLGDYRR